ncbi:hypothetical protein NG895_18370 [Aeoliella sp. ICT_H6.2]|uniref:Cobalt/nickel transport protein n=1 Tax=Aeoliella straminimaris TaxID=2954799 RepID=A0A9X2JK52_9BACT|nr:hypothetical protein [Aeoliella straminimaris]MCO6045869.1 hypothetical protein [Aeoliella straminimaris]
MKHVLLLALLLLTVGGWAATVEPRSAADAAAVSHAPQIDWVRTIDGWEPAANLNARPPADATLHPVVVAGFMALGSLFALLAPPTVQRD